MYRTLFLGLFIILAVCLEPKTPQLTTHDVSVKVEEILKAHAAYKKLIPN